MNQAVTTELVGNTVRLTSAAPLMFDRPGDTLGQTPEPEQKMYYSPGTRLLVMPNRNILSLLSATRTRSAPKLFLGKDWQQKALIISSCISIYPMLIPITRKGRQIEFKGWNKNGISLDHNKVVLKDGQRKDTYRPIIDMPWEITFTLVYEQNEEVGLEEINRLLVKGGRAIGLGTFRGVFGKFKVDTWKTLTDKETLKLIDG